MTKKSHKRIFDFYPLEDRVLLSGEGMDGLDGIADADVELTDALLGDTAPGLSGLAGLAGAAGEVPTAASDDDEINGDGIDAAIETPTFDPALPLEVIFIDAGVDDADTLLADLRSQSGSGAGETQWLVVTLSSDRDGVDQITDALRELSGVDAVHIISHGDGEGITLGNMQLDIDSASSYAGDIASWGHALDSDADLLIYGCDLASTESGQDLIDILAIVCDCDVAASDDATGSAELGGDWILEYTVGDVSTEVAFGFLAQASWNDTLATYTVTNTNDAGAGSFRQAIIDSNATTTVDDTIDFNIGTGDSGYTDPDSTPANGDEYWTITLASSLVNITDTVTIDATTQTGVAGSHAIVLDGNSVGLNGLMLDTGSDGSTVRGMVIHGFTSDGIEIRSDNNTIAGNYIGTGVTGLTSPGNANHGVYIVSSAGNTIGGVTANDRNVISGNTQSGIFITGAASQNNDIIGNYIGVDSSGNAAMANGAHGVTLIAAANNNTIGTDGDGSNDVAERNIISGNGISGVHITGSTTTGNTLAGNYIGLGDDGTTDVGNSSSGVHLSGGTTGNTIGGDISDERNYISNSGASGVLANSGSGTNDVTGNTIGLDTAGSAAGNAAYGIYTNTQLNIGGGLASEGNVISSNTQAGVRIDTGATNVLVQNNTIGLGEDGDTLRGNLASGIHASSASSLTISDNVVSGNTSYGIYFVSVTGSTIDNNYVGTDVLGLSDRGNAGGGIALSGSSSNTISDNVVSGNDDVGVRIFGATSTLNTVTGNYIGVDSTGMVALANLDNGVRISQAAHHNTIGGDRSTDANVISGNSGLLAGDNVDGILVSGDNTDFNRVVGNYIGTNADGTVAIANQRFGLIVWAGAGDTEVGGIGTGEGNVISGNGDDNLHIGGNLSFSVTNTVVVANLIGTNATGTSSIINGGHGIIISQYSDATTIGGATSAHRNVVSGNLYTGISVYGSNTTIEGNYIGLDITGESDLGNSQHGISLNSATTVSIEDNVISGNSLHGIYSNDSTGVTVQGNFIGTDKDGTDNVGNSSYGIKVSGAASNNVLIGGTTSSDRNLISGNDLGGVWITASNVKVQGNYIGTDVTGSVTLANAGDGVVITDGTGSIIGTDGDGSNDALEGNVISGNTGVGVHVSGANSNTVAGNIIGLDATGTIATGMGNGSEWCQNRWGGAQATRLAANSLPNEISFPVTR